MNFLYLLTIFISPILSSFLFGNEYEEKIIYFPITLNFNSYYANIYLGEPPQQLFLSLDQELQVTWADTIHYKQENSLTSKYINKTTISFRKINLFGETISDKISLINKTSTNKNMSLNMTKNITIDKFWFVVIGNSRGYDSRVGGIGLAYKFSDEAYSLIHHLKNNKLIIHLSYGFIPPALIIKDDNNNSTNNINSENNLNKEGLIFFGGMPKKYIANRYRYNCKVTNKYNFWSCELPYIFIGDISYDNNANNLYFENKNYAYFNGAERRILAPEDFMTFLKFNYFKNEITNGTCKYYLYGMNYVFECICIIKNTFRNISFIFNDYQYKFTPDDLFEYYGGGNCLFLIQGNHLRKNNFIIGTPFLKKFISNFDYETKYITFYSEKQIEGINLYKIFYWKKIKRYIIGIIFVVIIVGIILYIRRRIRIKKHKKELLLEIKSKGKNKIKKMNEEEEGYELK